MCTVMPPTDRTLAWARRAALLLAVTARTAITQEPVSRADAWRAASLQGARVLLSRADSAFARGVLRSATQFENPTLGVSVSRSAPQEHYALDLPLDYPWLRRERVAAATASMAAAQWRAKLERAGAAFEVDAAYTEALATARRSALSRATALDADSVLTLARLRRDAGDGSELDVQLAFVNAGQLANDADRDRVDAINAVVAVQQAMGMAGDSVRIALTDTLEAGKIGDRSDAETLLSVAIAEEELAAAERSLALARGLVWPAPALAVGFESRDPGGTERQPLPTVGLAFPLPLFNRNGGAVAQALALRDRAAATARAARLEAAQQAARALRDAQAARSRLERSQRLLGAAERVASLSLIAFREGAATLPSVLEAQRSARTAMSQFVTDLAAARTAASLAAFSALTVKDSIP